MNSLYKDAVKEIVLVLTFYILIKLSLKVTESGSLASWKGFTTFYIYASKQVINFLEKDQVTYCIPQECLLSKVTFHLRFYYWMEPFMPTIKSGINYIFIQKKSGMSTCNPL